MKVDTGSGGGKYRIVAEINMVPFIDIVLVLLIIFMVMTPFLIRAQIKVTPPEAANAEEATDEDDTVTVQVEKSGGLYIEGQPVAAENIEASLRRHLPRPQVQPLMIEADKDVPFQHVVVVLDAGKKLGVRKMGVGVQPKKPAKAPSR